MSDIPLEDQVRQGLKMLHDELENLALRLLAASPAVAITHSFSQGRGDHLMLLHSRHR